MPTSGGLCHVETAESYKFYCYELKTAETYILFEDRGTHCYYPTLKLPEQKFKDL